MSIERFVVEWRFGVRGFVLLIGRYTGRLAAVTAPEQLSALLRMDFMSLIPQS